MYRRLLPVAKGEGFSETVYALYKILAGVKALVATVLTAGLAGQVCLGRFGWAGLVGQVWLLQFWMCM